MERASNRFGILAVHALIWTLPFGLYYALEQPSVSQRFYLQVAASTVTLFYVGTCWIGGQLRLPRNGVLGAGLLVGLWATASSLAGRSPLFTFKEAAYLWCCLLVLGLVVHLRLTRGQSRRLLASLVFVAGICALYGVLQYMGTDIRWNGYGYAQESKIGKFHVLSLMGHPNYLTAFIGPTLLLVPGLIAAPSSGRMRGALCAAALVIALCVLVAGSRSAWLATALLGGALAGWVVLGGRAAFKRPSGSVRVGAILAVCVVALFVIPNRWVPRRYSFIQRLTAARPVESRLYFYVAAAQMIRQRPLLGVGYSNYGVEFWDYAANLQDPQTNPQNAAFSYILEDMGGIRPDQAHNEFLQIAAETGLPGLAAFFLLLVVFFRRLHDDYGRSEHWHDRLLLAGVGGAVVFVLVDGLFSFPLRLPCSSLAFWVLLGVGSRYAWPERVGPSAPERGKATRASKDTKKRKGGHRGRDARSR